MCIPYRRTRVLIALTVGAALLFIRVDGARAAASAGESTMAREIADHINRERVARGLSRIPYDASYSPGAQRVAEHNRDTPCHACHSTDHPSGEVVWWGSDYPSSGAAIWWMGSAPHRALILAPSATRIGVGVACNGAAHDAVAWIETQTGATNEPATPVATKASAGSRCSGAPTATTRGATSATTAPPPAAPTTTTTSARGTATTRSKATTSTTSRRAAVQVAAGDVSGDAPVVGEASTGEPDQLFEIAAAGQPIASASRPLAGSSGMGAQGTVALVVTFGAVIAVGRLTHRRRPPLNRS